MAQDIHMPLAIEDIVIPDGRRPVNPAEVKRLAESIEKIGLRHPITVRRKGEVHTLVAGRHRIEAFRKLGRKNIPSLIVSMTNTEARLWEIAENLHRADLTRLERQEQIAEWVRLTEEKVKAGQVAQPGGRQPNDMGISAASRELGIERTEVRRAVAVDSIEPEAKAAAREAGIDDNQSKLLKVAKAPLEQQVAAVHRLAAEVPRLRNLERDNPLMAAWAKASRRQQMDVVRAHAPEIREWLKIEAA